MQSKQNIIEIKIYQCLSLAIWPSPVDPTGRFLTQMASGLRSRPLALLLLSPPMDEECSLGGGDLDGVLDDLNDLDLLLLELDELLLLLVLLLRLEEGVSDPE